MIEHIFQRKTTINCRGKLIDLSTPKVMGVINITPDSFYDGGQNNTIEKAIKQAQKHLKEGATFLDIGGYSSRPDAQHISEEEEINRVIPVIKELHAHFPNSILSIDTFRSGVAEQAILHGASIINDISAGELDPNMLPTVAQLQVPYIAMHMKGTPQSMQENPIYNNVVEEIIYYFSKKIDEINQLSINDVVLDVGFGFGKSIEDNYQLLNQLSAFKLFNIPILTGISRKSMLYKPLEITPKQALNATSVAHTIALQNGSNILRVHDVKEALECIKLLVLSKNT